MTIQYFLFVVVIFSFAYICCVTDGFLLSTKHLPLCRRTVEMKLGKPMKSQNFRGLQSIFASEPLKDNVSVTKPPSSNLTKRWITGLSLGAFCTGWVASSNTIFSSGFIAASYIMLSEYHSMVKSTGTVSANRLGSIVNALCFITAAAAPWLHEVMLPMFMSILMITLMFSNNNPASINEIATSVLGVLYTGFLPSYWVRLRALGSSVDRNIVWTLGAAITWWTWTSIVFSDVGAYFVGKKYGRHKLSSISKAAGAASPNKTVEGALGGFLCCSLVATLGAFVMHWPAWGVTGPVYGLLLGLLGLLGDLTASVMKRNAGFKDSGTLLPGHGGLLDRFDSYILSAPVAYLFVRFGLPWVEQCMNPAILI